VLFFLTPLLLPRYPSALLKDRAFPRVMGTLSLVLASGRNVGHGKNSVIPVMPHSLFTLMTRPILLFNLRGLGSHLWLVAPFYLSLNGRMDISRQSGASEGTSGTCKPLITRKSRHMFLDADQAWLVLRQVF
jgi:hypothetical protein